MKRIGEDLQVDIRIIGGAYITPLKNGYLGDGYKPVLGNGIPVLPEFEQVVKVPVARYGRFDPYSKLGFMTVAMALKSAGLDQPDEKRAIGIVLSTSFDSLDNDVKYYETTREDGGMFTSPNLFSYTLPNVVIGECAIIFKCTGPTFIIGEAAGASRGYAALETGCGLIQSEAASIMVVGFLNYAPDSIPGIPCETEIENGCIVLILRREESDIMQSDPAPYGKIVYSDHVVRTNEGRRIATLTDLF